MNSKVPILLGVVFLSWLSWADNAGTPPQPLGDKTRFVIVSGTTEVGTEHEPTMYRMDTWTGETWVLVSYRLMMDGREAVAVPAWVPVQEADGQLVKLALESIKKAANK